MTISIYYKSIDGAEKSLGGCTAFTFVKEAFTPYTRFDVVIYSNTVPDDMTEIRVRINGKYVHHGIVDNFKVINANGVKKCVISSRGFTSLLTENQLPPGMYTDMSFNRLFDEYFTLPNITHEDNAVSSYIYVNKGTPMWDGAANLAYKLTGMYPYIRDTNKVMMSMPSNAVYSSYTAEKALNYGSEIVTNKMVSHYNMADINGDYEAFSAVSETAAARNIIRHRKFELDRRFLNNPESACDFRIMMSSRGYKRRFFTIEGYGGEDINDFISFEDIENQRIKAIKITGNKKGVFTEFSVYDE